MINLIISLKTQEINQVFHLKKEFKVIKNTKKIKKKIHMHQKIQIKIAILNHHL